MSLSSLGHAVRDRRTALGLSQFDVAFRSGLGEATVRRIERGDYSGLRATTRSGIEQALGWRRGVVERIEAGTATEDELTSEPVAAESATIVAHDPVAAPLHYRSHPSGVECIQITEHMGFNLGNAIKYIWRADLKGAAIEDLRKAAWYVEREIARREKATEAD